MKIVVVSDSLLLRQAFHSAMDRESTRHDLTFLKPAAPHDHTKRPGTFYQALDMAREAQKKYKADAYIGLADELPPTTGPHGVDVDRRATMVITTPDNALSIVNLGQREDNAYTHDRVLVLSHKFAQVLHSHPGRKSVAGQQGFTPVRAATAASPALALVRQR